MSRETIMSILTIVAMSIGGVSYINSLERRIAMLELQLMQNAKDDAEQAGYVDRLWSAVQPSKLPPSYKPASD